MAGSPTKAHDRADLFHTPRVDQALPDHPRPVHNAIQQTIQIVPLFDCLDAWLLQGELNGPEN